MNLSSMELTLILRIPQMSQEGLCLGDLRIAPF